jgi:hypothetical protein
VDCGGFRAGLLSRAAGSRAAALMLEGRKREMEMRVQEDRAYG